jgi:hypothetical protein
MINWMEAKDVLAKLIERHPEENSLKLEIALDAGEVAEEGLIELNDALNDLTSVLSDAESTAHDLLADTTKILKGKR